jgi:hypothetical protein
MSHVFGVMFFSLTWNMNNNGYTRKEYLNIMNKAIEALQKNLYRNSPSHFVSPMNRLTYQNIQNLKKTVTNARRPTNAHVRNNYSNVKSRNGKFNILFGEVIPNNKYGSFNVIKRFPNGTFIEYETSAFNNGKPINLNRLNVGLKTSRVYTGNKPTAAAITIQRAFRNKRAKGPFNSKEMQAIFTRHILPKLPKKNRPSAVAAFRPPTQLNKELQNRSRRVDPYWRALLNTISLQTFIQKGKPGLLPRTEWMKISQEYPQGFKNRNTREKAAEIIRTMRRRRPVTTRRRRG